MTHAIDHSRIGPDLSADLKLAMRQLAGGISVVTAGRGPERTGATVTSATALSVAPPVIIVTINRTSSTFPVLRDSGHFVVNILRAEHRDIADRFAGKGGLKGKDRFRDAHWQSLASGTPALTDALAAIDCEVEEIIGRHSHGIILGRVLSVVTGSGAPLAWHNGRYAGLTTRD